MFLEVCSKRPDDEDTSQDSFLGRILLHGKGPCNVCYFSEMRQCLETEDEKCSKMRVNTEHWNALVSFTETYPQIVTNKLSEQSWRQQHIKV